MNQNQINLRGEINHLRAMANRQMVLNKQYLREAENPDYEGQELICTGKADQIAGIAAANLAQADLLETQLDALIKSEVPT